MSEWTKIWVLDLGIFCPKLFIVFGYKGDLCTIRMFQKREIFDNFWKTHFSTNHNGAPFEPVLAFLDANEWWFVRFLRKSSINIQKSCFTFKSSYENLKPCFGVLGTEENIFENIFTGFQFFFWKRWTLE